MPIHTHSPLPNLLATISIPSGPAVILHPCWWSTSPHRVPTQGSSSPPPPFSWSNSQLPTQRSSSTTVGGQLHPSPPSGHPLPLLAANFTPPHPVVPWLPVFQGERDKEGWGVMTKGRRETVEERRETVDAKQETGDYSETVSA